MTTPEVTKSRKKRIAASAYDREWSHMTGRKASDTGLVTEATKTHKTDLQNDDNVRELPCGAEAHGTLADTPGILTEKPVEHEDCDAANKGPVNICVYRSTEPDETKVKKLAIEDQINTICDNSDASALLLVTMIERANISSVQHVMRLAEPTKSATQLSDDRATRDYFGTSNCRPSIIADSNRACSLGTFIGQKYRTGQVPLNLSEKLAHDENGCYLPTLQSYGNDELQSNRQLVDSTAMMDGQQQKEALRPYDWKIAAIMQTAESHVNKRDSPCEVTIKSSLQMCAGSVLETPLIATTSPLNTEQQQVQKSKSSKNLKRVKEKRLSSLMLPYGIDAKDNGRMRYADNGDSLADKTKDKDNICKRLIGQKTSSKRKSASDIKSQEKSVPKHESMRQSADRKSSLPFIVDGHNFKEVLLTSN